MEGTRRRGERHLGNPVYRREYGLWAHQKYFTKLAFDAHRTPHGARFVLADMVGLGKTIQLAMAAMLMALWGNNPVQLQPIEAWDLLQLLNANREHVLGNVWSEWNKPPECLPVVAGEKSLSEKSMVGFWDWFRNPVPPLGEDRDIDTLRRTLGMSEHQAIANGSEIDKLKDPERAMLESYLLASSHTFQFGLTGVNLHDTKCQFPTFPSGQGR